MAHVDVDALGDDAQAWARAFIQQARLDPGIATDEGTMIAWFANAIECAHDRRVMHDTLGAHERSKAPIPLRRVPTSYELPARSELADRRAC